MRQSPNFKESLREECKCKESFHEITQKREDVKKKKWKKKIERGVREGNNCFNNCFSYVLSNDITQKQKK